MGPGLLVSGTDTGVGKTTVSASLAAHWYAAGLKVRGLKPIESGVPTGQPGADAAALGRAAGHPPLSWSNLELAVSPHRAQRASGRSASAEGLRAWLGDHRGQVTVIEGAGGWRVPLAALDRGGFLYAADLARWAELPVLVVAANRLGVLNHTLLTVEAIERDGLDVAGVVLNSGVSPDDDPSVESNLVDLRELLRCPVVGIGVVNESDHAALADAGRRVVQALEIRF